MTRKFYQLESTASFVDGYCQRCIYIEPFLLSVEHSIVLAFQRDYEGAIKTIIPIFEGILRKYLINEHDQENKKIGFADLRKCFDKLRRELIDTAEKGFRTERNDNNEPINFSVDQIKQLVKYETKYLDKWFSFITGFVDDSLYLNTQTREVTDELNRHAILHEFGLGTEYNLENYLKIYMGIQFLTWIFLKKAGESLLNNVDSFRFLEKVTAYQEIIKNSESLLYTKHILYAPHKGYNKDLLQKNFPVKTAELLPPLTNMKYRILKRADKFLWKRKLK